MSYMPKDGSGSSIPLLGYRKNSGAHSISVSSSSNRNSTPFNPDCRAVRVVSTVPCFIEQGVDNSVVASSSSHYLPDNFPVDISTGGGAAVPFSPYLAVIRSTTDGTLYISELD